MDTWFHGALIIPPLPKSAAGHSDDQLMKACETTGEAPLGRRCLSGGSKKPAAHHDLPADEEMLAFAPSRAFTNVLQQEYSSPVPLNVSQTDRRVHFTNI
jgi:hypothetical protein